MKQVLTFIVLSFLIFSCKKNDSKYPYAIKDFSKTLRPHLDQIVSNGLIGVDYHSEMFVEDSTSITELENLSYCEHPLLRAVALRGLLKRDSLNKNDIILSHLSDTAFVATEVSHWRAGFTGVDFSSVADIMISDCSWKSFTERKKIIDKVLLKHNYLVSAYNILDKTDPEEKYYSSIREMLQRDRDPKLIGNAVIALSKFRKKEDIMLLKDIIKNNESLKYPPFVIEETNNNSFFNYFDTLRKKIASYWTQHQDTSNITWEQYEPIKEKIK